MRIGGFLPLSLSDFPGRVASVLFTVGCNLRCPWCHNPSLVEGAEGETPEGILERLAARRRLVDALVVTGGEPCLWPELPAFLRGVKALGMAVKLDTNGSRPAMLEALLAEGLVDFVAMDLKGPLGDYGTVAGVPLPAAAFEKSLRLLGTAAIPCELRTTVVPGYHDEACLDAMAELVPDGVPWRLQTLKTGGELLDGAWVEARLRRASAEGREGAIDALAGLVAREGLRCSAREEAGEMAVRLA